MATSFASVLQRHFDRYGAILAGGKVYAYEAGTTTPLDTYQDLAGVTANENPVILDSTGNATIRLTDGVAYKLVLKDSDDNTVLEEDNIVVGSAASSSTNNYLLAASYVGTPTAQGTMHVHIFDRTVSFPADLSGSQAACLTNPGAAYAIDIRKNGTTAGTLSFDTSGTPTFTTASGAAFSMASGDTLSFHGPDAVGTASDFGILLVGTV